MNFANGVRINRRRDHVALTFTLVEPDEEADANDSEPRAVDVTTVIIPLTTAIDIALNLLQSAHGAAQDLNAAFASIKGRIEDINRLSQAMTSRGDSK